MISMAVNEDQIGLSRDYIYHPGEALAEVLENKEISIKELADKTGRTEEFIQEFICGEENVSKSFASELERALGISKNFWIRLQKYYERDLAGFEKLNRFKEETF